MVKIPNNVKSIIEEFTNKVTELFGSHLEQIILYGSYARGDYDKNSDVDIMILTDLENKELENYYDKTVEIAYDIEFDNNFQIHLSPKVRNIDGFNYWVQALPFYMNVQKEGVVLNDQ